MIAAAVIPGISWWRALNPSWRCAFAEVFFRHANTPSPGELEALFACRALRFAGPTAAHPNMSFELTELSGLSALVNLETLVVIHQQIESLEGIGDFQQLKNLFVFNNKLTSLSGIETLVHLEQLYAQCNRITSIGAVKNLIHIKEFYISSNQISTLDGLTEEHADKLQVFFCRPNELLRQKEIIRVERELGIICRNG